mgnify:FL=1
MAHSLELAAFSQVGREIFLQPRSVAKIREQNPLQFPYINMITAAIQEAYAKLSSVCEEIFSFRQIFTVLKTGRLPTHIAFIMDGNRRWAKERGLTTKDGHEAGIHNLVKVCHSVIGSIPIFTHSSLFECWISFAAVT